MLIQKTYLEVKIGDRTYDLICHPDAPLGEVYDVLMKIKDYVIGRIVEQQKLEAEGSKSNVIPITAATETPSKV